MQTSEKRFHLFRVASDLRTDSVSAALRNLALGASVEVLAGQMPASEVLAGHLPRGTAVYVPFPPKGRWADTIAACERVLAAGMKPVPHLPARSVRSRDELGDWLSALVETGVDSLMLVAGDRAVNQKKKFVERNSTCGIEPNSEPSRSVRPSTVVASPTPTNAPSRRPTLSVAE